jgi:hypothetical protein
MYTITIVLETEEEEKVIDIENRYRDKTERGK